MEVELVENVALYDRLEKDYFNSVFFRREDAVTALTSTVSETGAGFSLPAVRQGWCAKLRGLCRAIPELTSWAESAILIVSAHPEALITPSLEIDNDIRSLRHRFCLRISILGKPDTIHDDGNGNITRVIHQPFVNPVEAAVRAVQDPNKRRLTFRPKTAD